MQTLRQTNEVLGFTKRSENEYDYLDTGYSSIGASIALDITLSFFACLYIAPNIRRLKPSR